MNLPYSYYKQKAPVTGRFLFVRVLETITSLLEEEPLLPLSFFGEIPYRLSR